MLIPCSGRCSFNLKRNNPFGFPTLTLQRILLSLCLPLGLRLRRLELQLYLRKRKGAAATTLALWSPPVRLSSLTEFGTPQFVADKLIWAERRKESTKQAEVIAVAERFGHGGLPVYEFDYTVDSTRGGMKRIFSAAFVALKKLYLLNISYSDKDDIP